MLTLTQAKTNDGEGPALLQSVHDGGTSSHAESLAATLAEHRQHLDSIQVGNGLTDVLYVFAVMQSLRVCSDC